MRSHENLVLAALLASHARAETSLTIHNQNFGVVRDVVPLDLQQGVNQVRFADTTPHLEPGSVILRDPKSGVKLSILEQNYRDQGGRPFAVLPPRRSALSRPRRRHHPQPHARLAHPRRQGRKIAAELSYVTSGMSWEADFNIVSPEKGDLEAYRVSTLANQARNKTEAVCAAIAPLVPQAGDDRSSPKMTKHAP